jgi:hypothetical protein
MKTKSFKQQLTFVLTVLAAIFILTLFTSCDQEHLSGEDAHVVLIDLDNEEYYTWSDLNYPAMNWQHLDNGEGNYEFKITGRTITLRSKRAIREAHYIKSSVKPDRVKIPLQSNHEISYRVPETQHDKIFKIFF